MMNRLNLGFYSHSLIRDNRRSTEPAWRTITKLLEAQTRWVTHKNEPHWFSKFKASKSS